MASGRFSECELLLIGGEIGSGKSTVAKGIADAARDCRLVRVRDVLDKILDGSGQDRHRLQIEGAALDERTGGRWLLEYLDEHCEPSSRWVVDSARTRRQVEPILESRIGSRLVYLAASESSRRHRFAIGSLTDPVKRSMPLDLAMRHTTESEARTISQMAHLVVETDDLDVDGVVDAVLEWCSWKDASG
jgi:hypothetical protein